MVPFLDKYHAAISNRNQTTISVNDLVHPDLLTTNDLVYVPTGFQYASLMQEAESIEYGAYAFQLNDFSIRFRTAKITPKKAGQFVTLWKRIDSGPIQPYDIEDRIDFFVICTRQANHFGQFVFPKSILLKHGVISVNGQGGKRAMRVYPPWNKLLNQQAQKTQNWQLPYFLDTPSDKRVDFDRIKKLYALD